MSNSLIRKPAPSFSLEALVGKDFKTITLHDYKGKWVVLFFYPMDFTFVCPTELVSLNEHVSDFQQKNAIVLAASTDTVHSHLGWVKADARLSNLKYPILADVTKKLSHDYGVLLEEKGIATRGTFIIDPEGIVRWVCINDLDVGRSVVEILRVIDALQTGELCPSDWSSGQKTLSS